MNTMAAGGGQASNMQAGSMNPVAGMTGNMAGGLSTGMSGGSMQGYNQVGPQAPVRGPTPPGGYMQGMPMPQRMQHLQQQQQQQRMMVMQQQQQPHPQQQAHSMPQPPPQSTMYSLQRQMSGGQTPQNPSQFGNYQF